MTHCQSLHGHFYILLPLRVLKTLIHRELLILQPFLKRLELFCREPMGQKDKAKSLKLYIYELVS